MIRNITPQQAEYLKLLEENPEMTNHIQFIRKNGLEESLNVVKRLSNIAPFGKTDKIKHLEELLNYVEVMINGDDIAQFCSNTTLKVYAQNALQKLIADAHNKELEKYKNVKQKLLEEISQLQNNQTNLLEKNEELEDVNSDLSSKFDELSNRYHDLSNDTEALEAKKQQLINEGEEAVKKQIEEDRAIMIAEFDKEREELQQQIETLKEQKAQLEENAVEAKQVLETVSQTVLSMSKTDSTDSKVEWKRITEDDPIYNTNYKTIEKYIRCNTTRI